MNYNTNLPQLNGYSIARFLKNMQPKMHIMNMGETVEMPQNKTDTVMLRRYLDLPINLTPLTEGTSNLPTGPAGLTNGVADNHVSLVKEDFSVKLQEYGNWTHLSDKALLLHTDDLYNEALDKLTIQARKTIETLGWKTLSACTQVVYTGTATQTSEVVAPLAISDIRTAVGMLEENDAEKISKVLSSSTNYGTVAVPEAYYGLIHTHLKGDLLNINETYQGSGRSDPFTPVEKYGNVGNIKEGEVGTIAEVRFLASTLYKPALGAGGVVTGNTVRATNTGGTLRADVYQAVILARDAFSTVAVKGKYGAEIKVGNPRGEASAVDPFGNLRTISWKVWYAIIITNPRNLVRIATASAT